MCLQTLVSPGTCYSYHFWIECSVVVASIAPWRGEERWKKMRESKGGGEGEGREERGETDHAPPWLWRLTVQQKTFTNFEVWCLFMNLPFAKLGGMASLLAPVTNPWKFSLGKFSTISWKFSHSKVSHYIHGITSLYVHKLWQGTLDVVNVSKSTVWTTS